ncbi:MAG: FecR domain-containing protein [bacterium]|nr:FecR domain-containing protein [bacterium]
MFKKYLKVTVVGVVLGANSLYMEAAVADPTPAVVTKPAPGNNPVQNPIKKVAITPAGTVLKADGIVKMVSKNKKDIILKANTVFFTHKTLVTEKNSRAAIRFNDGTFIVMGPDSALEIKSFHLTPPAKGQKYQGSPKDHALVKLIRGSIKVKMGALVNVNKPTSFIILTPRGRFELTDPQKNSNIDMNYNKTTGLAVKAVGVLTNPKGKVTLNGTSYGLVSSVANSAPTLSTTLPVIFSDVAFLSAATFYNAEITTVDSEYSESLMTAEENTVETEENNSSDEESDTDDNEDSSDDDSDDGDDDSGDDDSGDE